MAHMIDNSKGFNAFMGVGAAAWHGLGKIYTEEEGKRLTAEQVLVDSGNEFDVIKLPNIHIIPATREEIISKDSFFTLRTDVNKILGSRLGPQYEVLQNKEAFEVVNDILQAGKATIESAGVIDEGRKTFICLKIDKNIFLDSQDVIKQYAVIINSHDGTIATTVFFTNIRVVCNNTLTAALREAQGAIKIRHTSNAKDRLKEAAKVLKLIEANTEVNAENYAKMKDIILEKQQMYDYFGNLFFSGDEIKALQEGKKAEEVVSTRKMNVLAEVATFALQGVGQDLTLSNGNFTMWTAYNAVTGYFARKPYKDANDRANSMLFGAAGETIHKAGTLALTPEKVQKLSKTNFTTGLNLN